MNNIFERKSNTIKNTYIEDIFETIPKDSVNKRDLNLVNTHTEWRWRFFKFNNIKKVEISNKSPNAIKRLYLNNIGEWVERDIGDEYDNYVIKEYYYYSLPQDECILY